MRHPALKITTPPILRGAVTVSGVYFRSASSKLNEVSGIT
jgi:hypothetical protein